MTRHLRKLILIFFTLSANMHAQGNISFNWTHSWGGVGGDGAGGAAVDSAGNVYVVGSTSSFGAGGSDALLLKYDPAGHLQWARTWGGTGNEGLSSVVVDGNGFIYAVGATNSFGAGWYDFLILKFDTAGNFVWARTWGGGSFDQGVDISFDQNGNLAIAGEAYSFGACTVLLKFSTDGAFLSARTWNGPATYDSAYSITVDANGNQILTGISWDYSVFPNHNTILVLKYDSLGNLLWSRNWAGPSEDEAYGKKAVRTDAQGNIYIAGRTSASCTNPNFSLCDFDVLLLKIDPNGNLAWAQKWGGTGWDTASGLVLDSDNELIVVGSTASFFGGLRSALIQKYDSTGGGPLVSRALATNAASGWAGLVAGPSGVLVATGDGPNNGGTWQDTGIQAVPASGSLSSPPYSVGAPTGTTGTPSGSTGDPTTLGVADTGGGGSDVLTAAFSLGRNFLSFPLHAYTAFTANISTVMDHHIATDTQGNPVFYAADNFVTAYTGEEGVLKCAPATSPCAALDAAGNIQSPAGYKNTRDLPFVINGHSTYTGGSGCYDENGQLVSCSAWLFYEGHPGFDYPASLGTAVYAPAQGLAFIPDCDPVTRRSDCTGNSAGAAVDGFNILAVDHGNGYSTWYLHMGDLERVNAESATIPQAPFQVTVAHAAGFQRDLGVVYAAHPKRKFKRVASNPSTGQYSVTGSGVYTFSSGDVGVGVLISYYYAVDLRLISCPGQPGVTLQRGDGQKIPVTTQCTLGQVGNKAVDLSNNPLVLGAHLHFEVRKGLASAPSGAYQCIIPSCMPVDPYGWAAGSSALSDPYPFGPNIRLWK